MKTGAVSLALSAVALGAAGFALTRDNPRPERSSMRTDPVAKLAKEVAELKREVETLRREKRKPIERDAPESASGSLPADVDDPGNSSTTRSGDKKELEAVVDAAVDRKTKRVLDKLRIKADKKPTFAAFASVLELTKEQRASAERVVADSQRQIYGILDTPMANGTNLMDGLVEIMARGMAQPGKDHGWRKWFGNVVGEKIPGTNETYGARIDTVKKAVNATFQREWSEAQYKEFTEWQMDPTEMEEVPGSPYAGLGERIIERARALGAEIDDDK